MKTYNAVEVKPRLKIFHCEWADSPRKWDNLGYFYTKESKYKSPDGNVGEIYEAMIEAESEADSTESHIKVMTRIIEENTDEKVLAIYPIDIYEHSNIVYSRGTAKGFDYSNCGFYIITDKTQKAFGTDAKDFEKIIDQELKTYTKWANGEVYAYELRDKNGEVEDTYGDFYSLQEIKDNLPEEWANEDLEKYIT